MADITKVPLEEMQRREKHLMSQHMPFSLWNPFTWSQRYKLGTGMAFLTAYGQYWYGLVFRYPWYYSFGPRAAIVVGMGVGGYWFGYLREYQHQSRDAVMQHYMELHPEEFEHMKDYYGRPWSQVLLPYYPRRTHYDGSHKKDNYDFD